MRKEGKNGGIGTILYYRTAESFCHARTKSWSDSNIETQLQKMRAEHLFLGQCTCERGTAETLVGLDHPLQASTLVCIGCLASGSVLEVGRHPTTGREMDLALVLT